LALWLLGLFSLSAQGKIVSLSPNLTQDLFLLGLENRVVGYTSYCEPVVHAGKQIVATAVKVNLEKVVSLQPDLIVAASLTNPETVAQLQKFGLRVEVFKTPDSFAEICAQFTRIGQLAGEEKRANQIIERCTHKVDSLTALMKTYPEQKMFFQVGASPLYGVPPKTFMHDYLLFANGQNITDTPQNGAINREVVAVRNPDVIFLTAMGMVGETERDAWKKFPEITAVKNNRIYVLDSNKACSPTPVLFAETLDTISQLLR